MDGAGTNPAHIPTAGEGAAMAGAGGLCLWGETLQRLGEVPVAVNPEGFCCQGIIRARHLPRGVAQRHKRKVLVRFGGQEIGGI